MKNLGLLNWLSKRKLTDEKVANIFVNTSLEIVEEGWPKIVELLNDSPEFEKSPELDPKDYGRFLMIVVSANLSAVPKHFDPGVDRAIIKRCCAKFGRALGVPKEDFAKKVKEFRAFMKKINHPSTNSVTAMTRAVFYKYHLIASQDEYFKDMNVPNPIIMAGLRDVVTNFYWDWDEVICDNYKVVMTHDDVKDANSEEILA